MIDTPTLSDLLGQTQGADEIAELYSLSVDKYGFEGAAFGTWVATNFFAYQYGDTVDECVLDDQDWTLIERADVFAAMYPDQADSYAAALIAAEYRLTRAAGFKEPPRPMDDGSHDDDVLVQGAWTEVVA